MALPAERREYLFVIIVFPTMLGCTAIALNHREAVGLGDTEEAALVDLEDALHDELILKAISYYPADYWCIPSLRQYPLPHKLVLRTITLGVEL